MSIFKKKFHGAVIGVMTLGVVGCASSRPNLLDTQIQKIDISSKHDVVLTCAAYGEIQMLLRKNTEVIAHDTASHSEFQKRFNRLVKQTSVKRALGLDQVVTPSTLKIKCEY